MNRPIHSIATALILTVGLVGCGNDMLVNPTGSVKNDSYEIDHDEAIGSLSSSSRSVPTTDLNILIMVANYLDYSPMIEPVDPSLPAAELVRRANEVIEWREQFNSYLSRLPAEDLVALMPFFMGEVKQTRRERVSSLNAMISMAGCASYESPEPINPNAPAAELVARTRELLEWQESFMNYLSTLPAAELVRITVCYHSQIEDDPEGV